MNHGHYDREREADIEKNNKSLLLAGLKKQCTHSLIVKDESFDHEFGCEQIFYYECELCGDTHDEDSTIPEQIW